MPVYVLTTGARQDGVLCSQTGRLDVAQFAAAMRNQLRQYAGRRISDFLFHGRACESDRAQALLLPSVA
jgi:hypothetical protein